ncbi:BET1-like protein isoform X1 [Sturnira hondurensis]|uniref:BET1-like protein isoform X1 n=1 Tax=Sturnira hondurensis TaxID=192404 RepID=UPI00187AFEF5|nr:BET1-like protein isoform X1 [Sturnira hondurensis]
MQQSFVERLSCAKAKNAGSDRPAPPLPPGRFAPARARGHAYLRSAAGGGRTQPAPVSRSLARRRVTPERRELTGSSCLRGPLGAPRTPQPDLSRKSAARGGRGVAGSPSAGRCHVAGGCGGPGAGGRGQHDGRLGSGLSPPAAQSSGAVEEILDRENLRMADSLASKVTRLKALALDIDRDAEDQNRYLDGMDSDFSSVTGLLTGSVKRFSTMARSGRDNRKLLCGVAMGLIVAFFILSYLLSRART